MFIINPHGSEPIFEQIKNQVLKFIQVGVLKPNDKLPSVRTLATQLGINPNTVAKAYLELEEARVVYTLAKKGVFIADSEQERVKESVIDEFKKVSELCFKQGLSKDEMIEMIKNMGDKIC